jgi:predicted membrane chloride channel (bestrophin family)
VSDTYSFDNFFKEINQTSQLLTKSEVERMISIDMDEQYGSAYQELIVWCLIEIEISHKSEFVGDHPLALQLRTAVLQLLDKLAVLYNSHDQPVPFFYVHFVCILSVYYLPLFAVKTALNAGLKGEASWVSEIVSFLIVMLQLIFVIGLRVLGSKLANPYGSDNEDLSVIYYVSKYNSRMICALRHHHHLLILLLIFF